MRAVNDDNDAGNSVPRLLRKRGKMRENCEHKTLHFEGKRLAYLVCSCGKRWKRCVKYTKNIRHTFFRAVKLIRPEKLWKRFRFKTKSVNDYRPLIFNPNYPWWCSGMAGDESYAVIIAYLPVSEDLKKYWDDAFDIEFTEEEKIVFSDRFSKPEYFNKAIK